MSEQQQQAKASANSASETAIAIPALPVSNTTRTCNKLLGVNWLTGEVR